MTEPRDSRSDRLLTRLTRLYQEDLERTRAELGARPLEARSGPRVEFPSGSLVAVALTIVVVLVAPRLYQAAPGSTAPGSTAPASDGAGAGLGTVRLGSTQVRTPADAQVALETPVGSLLIGGWLRAPEAIPCPVDATAWNPCRAVPIFAAPAAGVGLSIYRLEDLGDAPRPAAGLVQPIVIAVHNSDPACHDLSCTGLAVADAIVWVGGPRPGDASSADPSSAPIDEPAVVTVSRSLLPNASGWTLLSTSSGPYGLFGSTARTVPANQWVWVATFAPPRGIQCITGAAAATSCPPSTQAVIFVDYGNGMPLELEITPGPSS